MLTADLVPAIRRGNELVLRPLDGERRARALVLAEAVLEAHQRCAGQTREDLEQALREIEAPPRDRKLLLGLIKLAEDHAELDEQGSIEPAELREALFAESARARREGRWDRAALIAAAAAGRSTTEPELERALFADLRGAQIVRSGCVLGPNALVAEYDRSQVQAVLLRAVRVRAEVRCAAPAAYRALFHRLKFLRLLFTLHPLEGGGYRLEIDGPFSLFEQVTKYGLQLAMLVPALERCDRWSLEAELRWGKARTPLRFHHQGAGGPSDEPPVLPHEIEELRARLAKLSGPWKIAPSEVILELPGFGLCVPDLAFSSGDRVVHLEVLGHWSRAAVWKRVELVEAGLAAPVLFAVSERLRVSEEVLGADLPSALYVYKGAISARAVLDRIEALAAGTFTHTNV